MKIKRKLITGFIIASLLVGLVGILGLYANNRIVNSFEVAEEHFGSIIEASNEVSSYAKRAEGHSMLFLTLHNESDRKKVFQRIESLKEQIEFMNSKVKNPDARLIINDMISQTDNLQSIIKTLFELHDNEMAKTGDFDLRDHEELVRKLDNYSSHIRRNGLELGKIEVNLQKEHNRNAKVKASSLYNFIFMISGISFISALVIGLVIDRSISDPLNKLKDAAIKMRNGNFNAKIDITSNDEIGELSDEFNKMAHDLQESNEELISSKEYTDNIVSSMGDSLIIVSADGIIQRINSAACSLLGYRDDELLGQPVRKVFIEGEKLLFDALNGNNKNKSNVIHNAESSFISKGQKEIPIIFSASIMRNKYGIFQGIVCVAQDITELKHADEQIRGSLKEKEVLLREIHHRVKNNMQIISSLFNHQMENISDEKVIDVFAQSQNRILSMSLVHEKLYQSRDMRSIDFKEYINDLGAGLFQYYDIISRNIKYNINIEDISLDIDLAIPAGLIINELITNSLKYAFPDGRKGEINVSFRSINEEMLELVVSDNGIGLPKDMDFKSTRSLGLHLVTILSENQLHGKIKHNRENGTEFQIQFKRRK